MNAHEFTVYPYHCEFLKDFPELSSWLNCNGFSLLHSHNDFRTHLLHTYWDDHTSVAEKNGTNDAENSLMITYCQLTKTVAVYHREIVTASQSEKTLIRELDRHIYGKWNGNAAPDDSKEEFSGEYTWADEMNNRIDDPEKE
jgi:hypothetical protein